MKLIKSNIDANLPPGYNEGILGGGDLKASDFIRSALEVTGKTQKWLAGELGRSAQSFSKKLVNNSLSAQEFIEATAALGYEVKLVEKESNEELRCRKPGAGPRFRQMVGKVVYDTAKSEPLCHTPWTDGWMLELYRDDQGRFFVVHYTQWEGGVNHISPCGPEDACALYGQYGDGERAELFEMEGGREHA